MKTKSAFTATASTVCTSILFGILNSTAIAQTLPTSGNGWTLSQAGYNWTLHSDVESAAAFNTTPYGWNYNATGIFYTTLTDIAGGTLTPTAGDRFLTVSIGASNSTTGASIIFQDVAIAAGTYSVSFDIAGLSGKTFNPPGYLMLLADTNNNGLYGFSERISTTVYDRPDVSEGGWHSWTYTFTITDDSLTTGGASVIGSDLGFVVLSSAANNGFAFDNLSISYTSAIPEPASAAALVGVAFLMVACATRRGRRVSS